MAPLDTEGAWTVAGLVFGALLQAGPMAAEAAQPAVGGKVILQCVVAKGGRLAPCTVVEEQPAGAGLGETALRMSKEMRVSRDVPVGGTLTIPVTLTPDGGSERQGGRVRVPITRAK